MVKTKLALECPTRMLDMVQPFADFDWILGHKVLEDKDYAEYYKNSDNIKFIDNSVEEKDEPISLDNLKKVNEIVGGTYIVAPDFIDDAEKTIEAYKACIKVFGKEKVVGVVHGPTYGDTFRCVNEFGPGLIAVPYDVCSKKNDPPWLMATRRSLVVSNIPTDRIIHLLGFSSLNEFLFYTNRPYVTSIDTGIPVLLGLLGKDILDPLESKEKSTFIQAESIELNQTGWTATCRNIALLRKWLP